MSSLTIEKSAAHATPKTVPAKPWRPVKVVLLFFLYLLLGLLVVDGLMHLAGVVDEEKFDLDWSTGWTLMPGRIYTNRREGFSRNPINSHGMIDREYSLSKPAGTFRIAVMGCSFTQADQVDREKRFCKLLEQQLNSQGENRRYEVMNFGVEAYNLGQQFLRMKTLAMRFEPDLVIFAARPNALLYMGHDPSRRLLNARPIFDVDANDQLIEDRNYQRYWLNTAEGKRFAATRWLRFHSRLWSLTGRCIANVTVFQKETNKKFNLLLRGKFAEFFAPKVDESLTVAEKRRNDPIVINAMRHLGVVASAIVRDANQICLKQNCRFLLLHLPDTERKRMPREAKIFSEIARQRQVAYLDMNPTFDSLSRQLKAAGRKSKDEGESLYLTTHLSALGNQCAAAQLFHFLQQHKDLLKEK